MSNIGEGYYNLDKLLYTKVAAKIFLDNTIKSIILHYPPNHYEIFNIGRR